MRYTREELDGFERWAKDNYGLPPRVDFSKQEHKLALGRALDVFIASHARLITAARTERETHAALVGACEALEKIGSACEDDRPARLSAPEDEPQPLLARRVSAWQAWAKKLEALVSQYPTLAWDDLIEKE